VHDPLSNGQSFRALTIIDIYSREALAIDVGQRLRGEHVAIALNRLVQQRGAPRYLLADNGAEFTSQVVDLWAYHHGVRIDFSRRGKPTDNAFIETFNGRLRDECLNVEVFFNLADVRAKLELWRQGYNQVRPHSCLHDQPPAMFAKHWKTTAPPAPARASDGRKMLVTNSSARVIKLSL
jgi:putative transposase